MVRRTILALLASLALVLVTVAPVGAAKPATSPSPTPVTYTCGALGVLTGTGTDKLNEKIPYTEVVPQIQTDPQAFTWKYNSSMTATLTDANGVAGYTLTESYAYNHVYKVDKLGNTTATDSITWTQSLTDPAGVVTTGSFVQNIVWTNGIMQPVTSISTPFPCEGPL